MADRGLVSLALRWWYLLVLCPIVAGFAGLNIVERIPSVYEASVIIAVNPITGQDGVPNVQSAQALADSYAEQIRANSVLTTAANSIGLTDVAATDLTNMVQAQRLTNTSLVRVTVQTTDADAAAQLANAIGQTFTSQVAQDQSQRYTSTQNNLVSLITQNQNDVDTHNHQIDDLRAQPASPERDAQIARLEDQVAQLQASLGSASQSLQSLQIASARGGTTLSVVDPAVPPTTPVRPNRLLSVGMAILAGVFAALGLMWLAERLDDRLSDAPRVRAAFALPTLGQIPQTPSDMSACNPTDAAVIAGFSHLRSALLSPLSPLDSLRRQGQHVPIVAVASARDGDGKSVVAANLAATLAHTGRRVILVDADLAHSSTQASLFGVNARAGLTTLLTGAADDTSDILRDTCVGNLRLLSTGPLTDGPTDRVGPLLSARLPDVFEELRQLCDVVVVDTPGVLGQAEGAVVSASADGVVLVLDARQARKRAIQLALDELHQAGANVIGVVMNRARARFGVRPALAGNQSDQTGERARAASVPRRASS